MTDDRGTVRIVLGGGGPARLFAIPFLLVGAWLGYHLVLGLVDFAAGRSGVEMIPGTLLFAIIAAAFLIPGWLLLASRAVVEINRTSGTVTAERDVRIYRHRSTRRLSEFSRLEVDVLTVSPGRPRSGRRGYQVELASASGKNQVVGLFDDADDALGHGRRLSALVGLPLEDHRFTDRPAEA